MNKLAICVSDGLQAYTDRENRIALLFVLKQQSVLKIWLSDHKFTTDENWIYFKWSVTTKDKPGVTFCQHITSRRQIRTFSTPRKFRDEKSVVGYLHAMQSRDRPRSPVHTIQHSVSSSVSRNRSRSSGVLLNSIRNFFISD